MANEGTSFDEGWKLVSRGCVCVFQVILACESIVLCKRSGNVLIGYICFLKHGIFILKIISKYLPVG